MNSNLIGNYIHYHYENYLKTGINRTPSNYEGGNKTNVSSVLQNFKERMQKKATNIAAKDASTISEKDLREYESTINLLNSLASGNREIIEDRELVNKGINDILDETFKHAMLGTKGSESKLQKYIDSVKINENGNVIVDNLASQVQGLYREINIPPSTSDDQVADRVVGAIISTIDETLFRIDLTMNNNHLLGYKEELESMKKILKEIATSKESFVKGRGNRTYKIVSMEDGNVVYKWAEKGSEGGYTIPVSTVQQPRGSVNLSDPDAVLMGLKQGNNFDKQKVANVSRYIMQRLAEIRTVGEIGKVLSNMKGNLFEFMTILGGFIGAKKISDVIGELNDSIKYEADKFKGLGINASWSGSSRTNHQISKNQFAKFFDKQYTLKNQNFQAIFTPYEVQGKVDASFYWNGDNSKDMRITAKNFAVNNIYNLHLQTSSLLFFLTELQDNNFVNHYLNLVSEHADEADFDTEGNRIMAHRTALYGFILTALYGSKEEMANNKIPNFMAINDSGSSGAGSVRVIRTSKIISDIMRDNNAIENIVSTENSLYSIKLKNDFVNVIDRSDPSHRFVATQNRIAALLGDAHKRKISITLDKRYIQNKMKEIR